MIAPSSECRNCGFRRDGHSEQSVVYGGFIFVFPLCPKREGDGKYHTHVINVVGEDTFVSI